MNHLKKLNSLKVIVRQVLEREPATRNSDDYLYYKVCETLNKGCINLPFYLVFINRKEFGLPPFESVRRSRQKIQAEHPNLVATIETKERRTAKEKTFRKFARG